MNIRQLARDLLSQKLRTFLTTFGIVWGTASVSLLLAFGQGLHKQMIKNTAGLGDNIVIGWPSMTSIPFEGLGKGRRIQLAEEDVELVRRKADAVSAISSEYTANLKLNYGTKTISVPVSGVTPAFGEMRNLIPQAGGRFLNPIDSAAQRRVVFIGNELATSVFGEADPIGKTVMLAGTPFLVVGVLQKKTQDSSYGNRDSGNAYIPGSTFRTLTGQKFLDNFVFQAVGVRHTEAAQAQVLEVLAAKHRFDPKDKEALSLWDTTEEFRFFDAFMLGFRLFLGIVGSLTLVVGGIGVSNIMNVVVEERTREIGIKMALGAKPRAILGQFLLETLLITAVGGVAGLAITAALCAVIAQIPITEYIGIPRISPLVGGGTALLLGLVGLLAGYFPARDAANLDPVVAMKA